MLVNGHAKSTKLASAFASAPTPHQHCTCAGQIPSSWHKSQIRKDLSSLVSSPHRYPWGEGGQHTLCGAVPIRRVSGFWMFQAVERRLLRPRLTSQAIEASEQWAQ